MSPISKKQSVPQKPKVLLLENISTTAWDVFKEAGLSNIKAINKSLEPAELMAEISSATILGIRSRTQLTKEVLSATKNLKAIGCFCIGTDQVDIPFAKSLGVPVFNSPYSNTRSVAEMAISHIISLFRKLSTKNVQMHQGQWQKSAENCHEIRGKKLGIAGYGHIGKQLGLMAESLGMQVFYYDLMSQLSLGNAQPVSSLNQLLASCDVISLHIPNSGSNKSLITAKTLAHMKPGSFLINLSRGSIVDISALADAIRTGRLGGAAIDVFPNEPKTTNTTFSTELQGLDNVILTPHMAGSTEEAQSNIGVEVANSICNFYKTGSTSGAVGFVNLQLPELQGGQRFIHIHNNVPGIMASINKVFRLQAINIDAQFLKTDNDIGYVAIDANIESEKGVQDILQKLRSITDTLNCYNLVS